MWIQLFPPMYCAGLLAAVQKSTLAVSAGAENVTDASGTRRPPVMAASVAYARLADTASTHSQGKTQRAAPNTP